MNEGLGASFDTGDPVPHWIETSFGGVNLDDNLKLSLATIQLVLPVRALWLAFFDNSFLGVFPILKHLIDVSWLLDMW